MNYNIVAKYIKNIDFNIPDAKSYFLIEKISLTIKSTSILKVKK